MDTTATQDTLSPRLLPDGTAIFWSVYRQQWTHAVTVSDISDREMAAMDSDDRDAIAAHLTPTAVQDAQDRRMDEIAADFHDEQDFLRQCT